MPYVDIMLCMKYDINMSKADEVKHTETIILGAPKTSEQQHPVNQLATAGDIDENSVPSVSIPDAVLLKPNLLQSSGRFSSPRMAIDLFDTPPVHRCSKFTLVSLNASKGNLADPFPVEWILPERVLNNASTSLHKKENPGARDVEFNGLGEFNAQSLRLLQNYFACKSITTKVAFEKEWLHKDTQAVSANEKLHLLNTVLYFSPTNGGLIGKSIDIEMFVDDLTTVCKERYINDKIFDFLLNLIDKKANSNAG